MSRLSKRQISTESKGHGISPPQTPATVSTDRSLLAAAIAVIFASAASHAQDQSTASQSTPQQLPKVSVQAEEEGYKADTVSSPKFTQPLVDTPQTITVIKKEVIAEQGVLSLSDALRNTPGITFQAGENGNTQSGDAIFMRGFDTQGSIFLDNVRDLGPAVRDVFNIEQVEIAKGPAGADNGRGAASGYVNLVSKTPLAEDAMSGTLSYGENARRRITADLNESINDTIAVRLNVVGQDGGVAGRDFIERQLWGVAPSITLGMGTDTRITLFTQHTRQDNTPDGGIPAIGISGYRNATLTTNGIDAEPVDTDNFYGIATQDFEDITASMYTVRIEHDLPSGMKVRNLSRYGKIEQERVLTAPIQAPTFPDLLDPNTWTVGRSRHASFRENKVLTNQTNLTADFKTGSLEHNLSGGLEFIYEQQFTPTYTAATGQVAANLYQPNRNDAAVAVSASGASTDGNTVTSALYVFDTVKLNDRWQINGSLRGEKYETETTTVAAPVAPATTGLANRYTDSDTLLSWKAGVLFKPMPNGSVYFAYANSFRPPSGDNFTLVAPTTTTGANANINSPALDPQEATNIELGTKWDLLEGKLAATAALFKSDNKNDLARTDPLDPDSVIQYGKREVKGVELGLVGQLTEAWQLSFGYTFQDTEVKQGAVTGTATTGAIINFSPKNSATLWTTYKLPFPLTLGGGMRYVDSQARTVNADLASITTGIVEVDSYAVFDGMATYDFTEKLALQLNAYNLLDEDYVASVNNSGQRYFAGTPRSFLLTAKWKF